MRVAVLGTGLIGRMITRELAASPVIEEVVAVDSAPEAVERAVRGLPGHRARGRVVDLGQPGALVELLKDFDAAVAALPHALSMAANEAAVAARCHLVDLVGSRYPEKLRLHEPATEAGVLLVTGCGVAPGIVNVLAARGIELLDEAHEAIIYCGGLPRRPQPPLHYQVVFRLESVMGLYTRPATAAENGEIVQLPPLSGLETVRFPEPVGVCEAAYSDAHSTAYTLRHKVRRLAEKTVRYPGHFAKMGVLAELGFLDEEPVVVGGQPVVPRRAAMAVLEPQLRGESEQDVTVARVVVRGVRDGRAVRHEWTMVDLYDEERGYTSMAKTTGFPAVIVTEWLAQGRLPERGFLAPEQLLAGDRFDPFLAALRERGVVIDYARHDGAA
ncbi:MAG TPA: saccharopine dehydrogenase C-terminal domain-containing protein [Limnochordales bacterium]|nr:saccharopine dehydrogenase C-terminal domain-containing protein [Limnochordales bacterium]